MRDALMRVSTLRDLLAGLFLLALAGCSATSMDEAAQAPADGSAAAIPPPATEETFPNLGSVPDEAPAVPSAAERQTVIEGLSADRANAQYTDQDLTGNVAGASVAPPEPAPPPEVISTEPPPAAAPTQPVEPAPVTPSEAAPASELPAESEPVTEATPVPDPSSADAPDAISPTAEAASEEPSSAEAMPDPATPAVEPLTQASSTMTAPPPAAPAPEATPAPLPPEPEPAAVPAEAAPEPAPVASIAAAPISAAPSPPPSAPAPSNSSLPLPGQPGTVIPPVSTHMPATLPPPSPVPPQPAVTAEPVAPPPVPTPTATMPAASASMPAMPPPTTVTSVVPSGPFPYPQATSRPATYASGAVTVDMSALDGGAPSLYPAAMSNAYAPLPAAPSYAQPAAYSPGAGAGGPAGLIYFGEGAAGLDASDREVLKSVAAIYRQRGGYIRLLGHASQDGGRATGFEAQQANLQLSWARANAVARELARQGVDPGAIETGAVGDSQPLYVESTPVAEAANRRVEIYILY